MAAHRAVWQCIFLDVHLGFRETFLQWHAISLFLFVDSARLVASSRLGVSAFSLAMMFSRVGAETYDATLFQLRPSPRDFYSLEQHLCFGLSFHYFQIPSW